LHPGPLIGSVAGFKGLLVPWLNGFGLLEEGRDLFFFEIFKRAGLLREKGEFSISDLSEPTVHIETVGLSVYGSNP